MKKITALPSARTVSVREFAAELGVGLTLVNVAIAHGNLPVIRFGDRVLITKETLEKVLSGEIVVTIPLKGERHD
jgi:excisionase family DNA binding protein